MTSLELQLRGYRLTMAEITYHMPDHPGLLQKFLWQEFDIAPKYPVFREFLVFWEREIEGKLHSVRIASTELIRPPSTRMVGHRFGVH